MKRTTNIEHRTSNIEVRKPAVARFLFGCSMFTLPLSAAEPELLTEARRALVESIPEIAIRKLEVLRADTSLTPENHTAATHLLGEALLNAGRLAEALRVVETLSDAELLKAHILAGSARWADALPIYERLANSADAPPEAKLGLGESLHATGRADDAITVLDEYVRTNPRATTARLRLAGLLAEARKGEAARKVIAGLQAEAPGDLLWQKYIEGRLLLLDGKSAEAIAVFEDVTKSPEHLSENLLVAATLAMTDARVALSGNEVADRVLESFISKNPESAWLELAFARLDQIYAAQKSPPEGELQKWAAAPERRRAAIARYFVTRMQLRAHKLDRAMVSVEAFIGNFPNHPLLPRIHIMQADVHLEREQFDKAVLALEAAERNAKTEELRAEIELRTGLVQYQQGEYLLASNKFESAARRSPKLRPTAIYNGALASLNQKNFEHFIEQYRELGELSPGSELLAELILEEGLLQARHGDPRAEERLQLFILNFAKHPRIPEARLALAEIAFASGNQTTAANFLQVVNAAPRTPQTEEHSAYLAIFLEEAKSPRDDAKMVELARQFLLSFPASVLLPEIRLKLGQVYFRNEDFANAETQLATIAKEDATNRYAESTLFLAGQSAMKTINPDAINRALGYFDQVVKRDGPLKLYARQQQAIVQSGLRNEAEAVKIYDIILAAQPEPELRHAALCAKGNSLAILGRTEPAQLEAALAAYDALAASDAPPAWRNQALYKKASALKLLGRSQDALMAYYDVLGRSTAQDREYLWYYKAGFEAAGIFEAAKDWKSAIGIYEKMAAIEGPRADEARMRVKRLRLEHFLWE
ncbi:MAG: tetratricopeptide repeat protein [Chthoniobacteraceae bacterium]